MKKKVIPTAEFKPVREYKTYVVISMLGTKTSYWKVFQVNVKSEEWELMWETKTGQVNRTHVSRIGYQLIELDSKDSLSSQLYNVWPGK